MLLKNRSHELRSKRFSSRTFFNFCLIIVASSLTIFSATQQASAQTFELNVACPSKYCVARFGSVLHGTCMINDSCPTGPSSSTHCEPVRPRIITPQEMLADLNYKLDTQFEVLYADNEKFLEQIAGLKQSKSDQGYQLQNMLKELKKTQEAQAMQATFFESMSVSMKKIAAEQNKELAKKIDENAKAYQQHLKRLTERARKSEANILQEMDKTFDVVQATSEGLVGVMEKSTDNTASILEIIKDSDSQFEKIRKNQQHNGGLIKSATKKIEKTHHAFNDFAEKTDGQLRALEHDNQAQHEQLGDLSKSLTDSKKDLAGIKKTLSSHAEKSDGLLRALEHDLTSISERISNLEKAEESRQKQLLKRLERLDQIEKRLAAIEPKKRKKKN